jgi:hypothetical protein
MHAPSLILLNHPKLSPKIQMVLLPGLNSQRAHILKMIIPADQG